MTATFLPLPSPHPQDCPVCGGRSRVRVSLIRWRDDCAVAAWPARIGLCPMVSAADALRVFLARVEPAPIGPGGAA